MRTKLLTLIGTISLMAIAALTLLVVSCSTDEEQTVDSGFYYPWQPPRPYKFSRNGESSVNTTECKFLARPIDYIYKSYLKGARINYQDQMDAVMLYYENGEYGLHPAEEVAASPRFLPYRNAVRAEMQSFIDISAQISGYGERTPSKVRNRMAKEGQTGYVGLTITDNNIFFVDTKGRAVAQLFRYGTMGSIYLDKIYNVHLNDTLFTNAKLIQAHESLDLLKGHNYTALEHHLDLAYGYYQYWKPIIQSDGIPILNGVDTDIFQAFVNARIELGYFHYDKVRTHIKTIKDLLAKAIAVRAMFLLQGNNTLANLSEDAAYAYSFLSDAEGLIYALQFTQSGEGKDFWSRAQVLAMIQDMEKGSGMWEVERLQSDATVEGSLENIALRVGEPFSLTLNDIKR